MRKSFVSAALLISGIVNVCWSQPQEIDTTAAWRYYPLATGNVWEYQGYGMEPGDRRVWIEKDTVVSGRRYFIEASSAVPRQNGGMVRSLIRFDTTLASVVTLWPDGTEKIVQPPGCPLDAPFGKTVLCPGWGESPVAGGHGRSFELLDGSTISNITIKEFGTGYGGGWSYIAGIGYVGTELGLEPGGKRLAYARIDGVEYGSALEVGAETPSEPASSAALIYPNPVGSQLNVSLRIARSSQILITMYDLLGREVIRLHNSRLMLGEHKLILDVSDLASGAYIISVNGEGGIRESSIVVVE